MISSSKFQKTLSVGSWIDADQDLLSQILVLLPSKSITRFKSVSKSWISIVSDPHFISVHARRRNSYTTPSGLFFHTNTSPMPQFLPKNSTSHPPPSLAFLSNDPTETITILQSCNGLMLCSSSSSSSKPARPVENYYVCNPSTRQFTIIPHPAGDQDHDYMIKSTLGISLAFDPLRSPNEYKLVSLSYFRDPIYYFLDDNDSVVLDSLMCQFEVYSSGDGSWRFSGDPFVMLPITCASYKRGLFVNGAIHWLAGTDGSCLLYFDIENEILLKMRMPTLAENETGRVRFRFLGECDGKLYIYSTTYDVFEMENDYSGWIFKFKISPSDVAIEAPEMFKYKCKFLGIFPGDSVEEDELAVVISVPGKIISYCPRNKSSKLLLLDRSGGSVHNSVQSNFSFNGVGYHYIETLYQ